VGTGVDFGELSRTARPHLLCARQRRFHVRHDVVGADVLDKCRLVEEGGRWYCDTGEVGRKQG